MTIHEILSLANKCNVMPECCTDEALFEFAKQIILQERVRK